MERDFYLRHTGSALGILWSLVVPLAQLAVLTFTFSNIIRVDIQDYPAFVFSALLPWTWFSNSLSGPDISFSHIAISTAQTPGGGGGRRKRGSTAPERELLNHVHGSKALKTMPGNPGYPHV